MRRVHGIVRVRKCSVHILTESWRWFEKWMHPTLQVIPDELRAGVSQVPSKPPTPSLRSLGFQPGSGLRVSFFSLPTGQKVFFPQVQLSCGRRKPETKFTRATYSQGQASKSLGTPHHPRLSESWSAN